MIDEEDVQEVIGARGALRAIALYMLLDGSSTVVFGKRYLRLYRYVPGGALFRAVIDWLGRWPAWALRLAGAAEACLGYMILRRAPFEVPELYRAVAATYAAVDPEWRRWFYVDAHRDFDRHLTDFLSDGGRVLDLACGAGANLARITDLDLPYDSYTGVDLTPAMLAQAQRKFGKLSHVVFHQMDLLSDPLPGGDYDLIISTWAFEHLPDPARAVQKAWERLRPGGHMLLLFEVVGHGPISGLIRRTYPLLSVRPVDRDLVRQFPGLERFQRFTGPIGDLGLVIIEKPEERGGAPRT